MLQAVTSGEVTGQDDLPGNPSPCGAMTGMVPVRTELPGFHPEAQSIFAVLVGSIIPAVQYAFHRYVENDRARSAAAASASIAQEAWGGSSRRDR